MKYIFKLDMKIWVFIVVVAAADDDGVYRYENHLYSRILTHV